MRPTWGIQVKRASIGICTSIMQMAPTIVDKARASELAF